MRDSGNEVAFISLYFFTATWFVSICFDIIDFTCRYVTCDYSVWSSWSVSCGNGMKRKRTLTKTNEHTMEQQGGCSGLTTTCEKEKTETKDMLCKFGLPVGSSWSAITIL